MFGCNLVNCFILNSHLSKRMLPCILINLAGEESQKKHLEIEQFDDVIVQDAMYCYNSQSTKNRKRHVLSIKSQRCNSGIGGIGGPDFSCN
ncbi:hypothetical protein VNO77_01170 [Canavalia gladiata]|uniref:Uncharacterized protein n=1 Tax=Canavalia gladiata TaxID=3824 RepID=A0AAN9MQX6_CANGL